jgi:hypothetical protein
MLRRCYCHADDLPALGSHQWTHCGGAGMYGLAGECDEQRKIFVIVSPSLVEENTLKSRYQKDVQ